jgi:hypothetical protein
VNGWAGSRFVILASDALVVYALNAGAPTAWWRAAAVFWFVAVVPGLAVLRLVGLSDRLAALALVVPTSLAIGALVTEGLALAARWSADGVIVGLAAVTVLSCVLPGGRASASAASTPVDAEPDTVPTPVVRNGRPG